MSTNTAPKHTEAVTSDIRPLRRGAKRRAAHRTRRRHRILGIVGLTIIIAVITAMMLSARATTSSATRVAPDFTLTDTSGNTVRLADYRGRNVLLYFSEGAGCQACLLQMVDIEAHATQFATANVVIVPIVMNPAAQIRADMTYNNVKTPFLLDTGSVSRAYGTLGKGMHAGLPGHSFVLIDTAGTQRWYGEYPSMYLPSAALLKEITSHLTQHQGS